MNMKLIIFVLSLVSIACSAVNEEELYDLQLKMIGDSLTSDNPLCYNYGKPYQKTQQELATLVAKSTVNDSKFILEAAVMADSINDVRRFVEAGAPFITHKYSWGASLLHIAAINSSPSVIKYLISQGINVNEKINATGVTPLHLAVNSNKRANIEVLIKYGADVNLKNKGDAVPIIYTMGCRDIKTFQLLIEKGTHVYPKVISIAKMIGASIER